MSVPVGTVTDRANGDAQIALKAGHELTMRLDGAAETGAPVTIGIRPEGFQVVSPEDGTLAGDVQIAEQFGGETFVCVTLPDGNQVTVQIKGQADVCSREHLGLTFEPGSFHVFGADERVIPHG